MKGFVLILSWLLAAIAYGQEDRGAADAEFVVKNWQIESGLPNNGVNVIAKSKDGFLWVGTGNGVARFDGMNFAVFGKSETTRTQISALLEDPSGHFWVGTKNKGLCVVRHGVFAQVPGWPEDFNGIASLHHRPDHKLWIEVSRGRIIEAEVVAGADLQLKWRELGGEDMKKPSPLTNLITRKDGAILGHAKSGLVVFRNNQWESYFKTNRVIATAGSSDGGLWVVDGNRVSKFDADGLATRQVTLPQKGVFIREWWAPVIAENQRGGAWIGASLGGVFELKPNGEIDQPIKSGGLYQSTIFCIMPDEDGSVWIGTEDCGLYRMTPKRVTSVRLPGDVMSYVQTLCMGSGDSVWIGTLGSGLFWYRQGELKRIEADSGLSNSNVKSVLEDRSGRVWVGTSGGLYTGTGGRFERIATSSGRPVDVVSLFEDSNSQIWVLGIGFVGRIERKADGLSLIEIKGGSERGDIRAIAGDGSGGFWIGIYGSGLHHLVNGEIGGRVSVAGLEDCVNVVSLYRGRSGVLWIGDYANGLFWMKDGRVGHVTASDGLVSNAIAHLIEDESGKLWIGTDNGVMAVSISELMEYPGRGGRPIMMASYNMAEGMESPLCSGGGMPAFDWDRDGRLWFPNMKGVGIIDPRRKMGALFKPIVLDRIRVNEKDVAWTGDVLEVSTDCKRLELGLAALDLASPERVHLKYKLSGFDDRWWDPGFSRIAQYQNLPVGEYEFNAFATGRDGSLFKLPNPLTIVVVPKLWERTSFKIAVSVLALAAVSLSGWWVLGKKSKREIARLEGLNLLSQERARIARDIHDEIGAGLAQIGFLADLGGDSTHAPEEAGKSFRTIGKRARNITGSLDGIVWAINPQNDTLEQLIGYLVRMGGDIFEGCGIRFSAETPTDYPDLQVRSEVRYNLAMAVRESLANALKHSGCKSVKMRILWEEPSLSVQVSDDGCGFKSEQLESRGNGLGNQRTRMKRIGGEVRMNTAEGSGTQVLFRISP